MHPPQKKEIKMGNNVSRMKFGLQKKALTYEIREKYREKGKVVPWQIQISISEQDKKRRKLVNRIEFLPLSCTDLLLIH